MKTLMTYFIFFEIWFIFYTCRISQFGPTTFQELNSHIWLVTTINILDREILDHISNFNCKERKEQRKGRWYHLCGLCSSTSLIHFPLLCRRKYSESALNKLSFKWHILNPTWSLPTRNPFSYALYSKALQTSNILCNLLLCCLASVFQLIE